MNGYSKKTLINLMGLASFLFVALFFARPGDKGSIVPEDPAPSNIESPMPTALPSIATSAIQQTAEVYSSEIDMP